MQQAHLTVRAVLESNRLILNVKPIYGWGWFRADRAAERAVPIEVPAPFELAAVSLDADAPSTQILIGQLDIQGHPLSGLWLSFQKRYTTPNNTFNIFAYSNRPEAITAETSEISGYAEVEISS